MAAADSKGKKDLLEQLGQLPAGSSPSQFINKQDAGGRSLVHRAALSGDESLAQACIERGGDPSVVDGQGQSAVHLSLKEKHLGVARIFLKAPQMQTQEALEHQDMFGRSVLHWACHVGATHVVRTVLEAGANVNIPSVSGDTPLFWAAQEGNFEIVQTLLQGRADVQIKNKRGDSVRDVAAGFPDVLALVVSATEAQEKAELDAEESKQNVSQAGPSTEAKAGVSRLKNQKPVKKKKIAIKLRPKS